MTNTVIDEIAAERRRQIEAEGFDADHDAGADHRMGQLARAASAYAYYAGLSDKEREEGLRPETFVHFMLWKLFPAWGTSHGGWFASWWKPTNRRRDLIKAAALIVAEIERLDRGNSKVLSPCSTSPRRHAMHEVAIRPLEWEDADEGMCTKWRAAALGGHYELVAFEGEDGFAVNFYWGRPLSFWFIQGDPDEWGPTGPKMFPSLDEAKAAAQADYEARIRSALTGKGGE